MEKEKNNINIVAKSIEDFKKLEDFIKTLPTRVLPQIKSVEFHMVGLISIEIKKHYGKDVELILPTNPTSIKQQDDRVYVYYNQNYFFCLLYEKENKPAINFTFVE